MTTDYFAFASSLVRSQAARVADESIERTLARVDAQIVAYLDGGGPLCIECGVNPPEHNGRCRSCAMCVAGEEA